MAATLREALSDGIARAAGPVAGPESADLARKLVGEYFRVREPRFADFEEPDSPLGTDTGLARIGQSYSRSVSWKPGNVVLNSWKLLAAVASGALALGTGLATPWGFVFFALFGLSELRGALRVELGESDASVLWTLWKNRDSEYTVATADVFEHVRAERARYDRSQLTRGDVTAALGRLAGLRCIEPWSRNPDRWYIRESVLLEYD